MFGIFLKLRLFWRCAPRIFPKILEQLFQYRLLALNFQTILIVSTLSWRTCLSEKRGQPILKTTFLHMMGRLCDRLWFFGQVGIASQFLRQWIYLYMLSWCTNFFAILFHVWFLTEFNISQLFQIFWGNKVTWQIHQLKPQFI